MGDDVARGAPHSLRQLRRVDGFRLGVRQAALEGDAARGDGDVAAALGKGAAIGAPLQQAQRGRPGGADGAARLALRRHQALENSLCLLVCMQNEIGELGLVEEVHHRDSLAAGAVGGGVDVDRAGSVGREGGLYVVESKARQDKRKLDAVAEGAGARAGAVTAAGVSRSTHLLPAKAFYDVGSNNVRLALAQQLTGVL